MTLKVGEGVNVGVAVAVAVGAGVGVGDVLGVGVGVAAGQPTQAATRDARTPPADENTPPATKAGGPPPGPFGSNGARLRTRASMPLPRDDHALPSHLAK